MKKSREGSGKDRLTTTKGVTLQAIWKAAMAALSSQGPEGLAAASFLDAWAGRFSQENTESLFRRLTARVVRYSKRMEIDQDKLEPWVMEVAMNCIATAARTQQEEKLEGAARIFWNAFLKDGDEEKLSFSELDRFIRVLDRTSTEGLRLLAKLARNDQSDSPSDYWSIHDLADQLGISESWCNGVCAELEGIGLVETDREQQLRKQYQQAVSQVGEELKRVEEEASKLLGHGRSLAPRRSHQVPPFAAESSTTSDLEKWQPYFVNVNLTKLGEEFASHVLVEYPADQDL